MSAARPFDQHADAVSRLMLDEGPELLLLVNPETQSVLEARGAGPTLFGATNAALGAMPLASWVPDVGAVQEGVPFDPEGVLSTLPAIVNVLAGFLAADLLKRRGSTDAAVRQLLVAAALVVLAGLAWHGVEPFNKKLWTPSYVLVTCGIATATLALLCNWLDLLGHRRGAYAFEVLGRNTLAIYLLAELGMSVLWLMQLNGKPAMLALYERGFASWAGAKPGSLLFALGYTAVFWLVAWWMDRRGWYVRL
jgi:predicted acyltransferase